MKFTKEQQMALSGPAATVVMAGPGSGKTELLVERICRAAVQSTNSNPHGNPKSVVAITYTRKAAREIKQRLAARGVEIGYVGTVHGWCLSLLNRSGGDLSACPQDLFEHVLKEQLNLMGVKRTVSAIMEGTVTSFEVVALARTRAILAEEGLIDYDNILVSAEPFIRGIASKTRILIDEYQDSGEIERRIYEGCEWASIFAVGDKNQTLHEWRGASASSMDELALKRGATVFTLTENHRSTHRLSEFFRNFLRACAEVGSYRVTEKQPFEDVVNDLIITNPNVIICGQNRTCDRIATSFIGRGANCARRTSASNDDQMVSATLFLRAKPDSEIMKARYERLCPPGVRASVDETVDRLIADNPGSTPQELAQLVLEQVQPQLGAPVIMTCHGAKGLQFEHVAFVDDLQEAPHHNRMRYVAMTRACKKLDLYAL